MTSEAMPYERLLRGEFRPIYTVLLDGPDFQGLGPDARYTFLVCKLSLGAAGIGVLYSGTLAARTGLTEDRVATALDELVAAGWIRRERNVAWVVDGLRFEPSMSAGSATQRRHIQRHVAGLPRTTLIDAYRERYTEWFADAENVGVSDSPAIPPRYPLDAPAGGSCGSGSGSGSGSASLTTRASRRRSATEEPSGFAAVWAIYPHRAGGNPRPPALRAYRARIAEGVTHDDLLDGVRRYAAYCEATGRIGTEFVKMTATFFGRDRHYAEKWEPAPAPESSLEARVRQVRAEEDARLASTQDLLAQRVAGAA
ncbi:MAG: hypothetical protein ACREND_17660 [Gemmatimonadaceae bacterium]